MFTEGDESLPHAGSVANSVVYWVVASTGWHRNGCGTSGPKARANSVAWGGLQYVYQ